jgi:hypothetical protein
MKVSRDELALRLRNAYTSGAVPPLRDGLDPLDVEGPMPCSRSILRTGDRKAVGS